MPPVRSVCDDPDLTAKPVPPIRVSTSGDVDTAPQHPMLGCEHGEVGERVALVAVGARTSGEAPCDFPSPAQRCSLQRLLVASANVLNWAAGPPM